MPNSAGTNLLIKYALLSYFLLTGVNNYAGFLDDQLVYSRVKTAYDEKYTGICAELDSTGLSRTDFQLMIKAYKYEQELVLYVKKEQDSIWTFMKKYAFCSFSGDLGPKVQQGDMQIPEGYYHLNHFNPYSNFFLSLGVSYPNLADKRKRPAADKGGSIYIHGNCVTIGCIPITDDWIKELYILAVMAKDNGQSEIGIHIFPFMLTENNLKTGTAAYPEFTDFWNNLFQTEKHFNSMLVQKKIGISETGDYYLK